jgi:hypothetical protein
MSSARNSRYSAFALGFFVLFSAVTFATEAAAKHHKKWKHGGGPVQVVDVAPVGTLTIRNPSAMPARVELNGQLVGRVGPGGVLVLAHAPAGANALSVRFKVAGPDLRQHFTVMVPAYGRAEAVIAPPLAELEVFNRQRVDVVVRVDGQHMGRLHPGASMRLSDLAPGRHAVSMEAETGLVAATNVRLHPGCPERWAPGPMLGAVLVRNHAAATVEVAVGGAGRQFVPPGGFAEFRGVPMGTHRVRVTNKAGHTVSAKVQVQAGSTTAWNFVPPSPHPHGGGGHKGHGKHGKGPVYVTQAW